MMFGWMNQSQTGIYASMNSHNELHGLCPYPCPYSLDQLHSTPEYAPTPHYVDLRNIFIFPNVMTTASNEDIPGLDDVWTLNMDSSLDKLLHSLHMNPHQLYETGWICLWTLKTCVIMDTHEIEMHLCCLNSHKLGTLNVQWTQLTCLLEHLYQWNTTWTWNIINNEHCECYKHVLQINDWNLHKWCAHGFGPLHQGISEDIYQWITLGIYDSLWTCVMGINCIICFINYDINKWSKHTIIQPAVSIRSYKNSWQNKCK